MLRGNPGNDSVFGGPGNDRERGGVGNDLILDHSGIDRLFGDTGNDRLNARDFARSADLLVGVSASPPVSATGVT
jgi:Ca2+-binding RTX toxin-like protein